MSSKQSLLCPQHPSWNRDLPESAESAKLANADLDGQLNNISDTVLELGRSRNANRGLSVLFAALLVLGLVVVAQLGPPDLYRTETRISPISGLREEVGRSLSLEAVAFLLLVCAIALAFVWIVVYLLRLDISQPRDMPVRFNRRTGRVYFCSYTLSVNPFLLFGKAWGPKTKVWDWSTVHAEVVRSAGFTGKVYQVRFGLVLSTCKPGSYEVVDREAMAGPSLTYLEFDQMWTYICRFMANGVRDVPKQPARDRGVYFWRSLFHYAEWAAPTKWGREARSRAPYWERVLTIVLSPVLILLLPLTLVLGLGHYMAMGLAREATWPAEIDEESRA
jgi:hypothetical protein